MAWMDPSTGDTFPHFVFQWHTDRRLFGHMINYGQYSIHDLTAIMDRNDELRKYRWISSLQQGHYDKTTDYALESCKENKSLESTLWSLSLAKLTSKLGAAQNPVQQSQIEKQIDLVNAQKMLEGDDEGDSNNDEPLLSQDALIALAIEKLTDTYDREEKLRLATIGLAVCASLDDERMILEYT
jgi:hypothetical protein